MKKIKLVALMLVLAVISVVAAGCGSSVEKVSVNVTVTAIVDGETKFGPYDLTVEGTVEDLPTVLDAVTNAFIMNEIAYEIDDSGLGIDSVTLDGTVYTRTMEEDVIWGWIYTANGIEPETGRMGVNTIAEGDSIELIYRAFEEEEMSE